MGFWEPLVLVIGICEAYRASIGWRPPYVEEDRSANINKLLPDYEMGDLMWVDRSSQHLKSS